MDKPIYFSKIEFSQTIGYGNPSSAILLNIPAREISYQVFSWEHQAPAIQGIETEEWYGKTFSFNTAYPAKLISSNKTNFKPKLLKEENCTPKAIFSHAIKLTEAQMKELLPLCNALEFEPFRNKKMIMGEEGYCGYRDEVNVKFIGITDSHIPLIELPMDYLYDEEHIWPSEKLYRYIIKQIFEKEPKMQNWYTTYSGLSLPI